MAPGGDTPFTDAQATAVSNLLRMNDINSPSQIAPAELPKPILGLDELIAAFGLAPNTPASAVLSETIEVPLFGDDFMMG